MGVYIKGVTKQELKEIFGKACILYNSTDLVEVKTPHGRLIDAKLLADTINKAIQDGTFTSKSIWEWIGDAPTILEGEE